MSEKEISEDTKLEEVVGGSEESLPKYLEIQK